MFRRFVISTAQRSIAPRTLVNFAKAAGATVKISATATSDDETTTINVEGVIGGPTITQMGASGGNGKLVVSWTEPANAGSGAINGYTVQRRSGTSGNWTNVTKSASDRSHTFTGVANGTWQVGSGPGTTPITPPTYWG